MVHENRYEEPDEPEESDSDDGESGGETDYLTEQLPTSTRLNIRMQVFLPSTAIILVFVVAGTLFTEELAELFETLQVWITQNLNWFYIISINFFLVFVIWLALSRYGSIKLGPDDAEPDFSYISWFVMIFSAGIGIGFLFFGVAEPISHYAIDQPHWVDAEPGTADAARGAMMATFLHWGLHGWAVYAVIALALCYFAYRRGLPLALRSAFHPILGERIRGWMGDVIDTFAVIGTLFGVSVSLGLGATQINSGLGPVAGIESSVTVQIILIVIITILATISVVLGVQRGMRRFSLVNMILLGIILVFVFIFGPTNFLLSGYLENIGLFLRELPVIALDTATFDSPAFLGEWTIFYWGWWASWSPFVGMFIARISRGRTIREFIAGVLLGPVLVTLLVYNIFGFAGIHFDMESGGEITAATEEVFEFAFFALLEFLPWTTVMSVLAIIVIVVLFVTSSDSGSLVNDIHASGGDIHPSRVTRVYWSVAEALVAIALLLTAGAAGLSAYQLAVLVTGLPLTVLLLLMCFSLVRSLRVDGAIQDMLEEQRTLEDTRRAVIHDRHQESWPIRSGPWFWELRGGLLRRERD